MSEKHDNENALAIIKDDAQIAQAQQRHNEVMAIRQTVFQPGVHFGPPYKGAKNDTLLKPGATFLQQKYGLHEHHERIETTIHVDKDDLSKSYVIIQDRCRIYDADGVEIAQADAACSTFEDKYLYRDGGDRVCPQCNSGSIMRSAYPPRNNPNAEKGWYCNPKSGGCGANFDYDTPVIKDQEVSKKRNENPLNLLDTIVAMAQKRSSVRSTIKATGVDALFSPGDGVTADYMDTPDTGDVVVSAIVDAPAQPKKPDVTEQKPATVTQLEPDGTAYDLTVKANFDKLMFESRHIEPNGPHRKNTIELLLTGGYFAKCATIEDCVKIIEARPDKQQVAS